MKPNQQVTSLELSKKLKELGVSQESLFYWIYTDAPLADGSRDKVVLGTTLRDSHWELGGEQDTYSAYTVAELGDLLPEPDGRGWVDFTKLKGRYVVTFKVNSLKKLASFQSPTEADARAKMLVYLIENGLLDVKTLK